MEKLFNINYSNVKVEKLKEQTSSILGLFTKKTKKDVIDLAVYKSNTILALSDSSIIIYDSLKEILLMEINVIVFLIKELFYKNLNLLQLIILYESENIEEDVLLCLCDKNLIFMDVDKFQIK
jgi:hypothetical protein